MFYRNQNLCFLTAPRPQFESEQGKHGLRDHDFRTLVLEDGEQDVGISTITVKPVRSSEYHATFYWTNLILFPSSIQRLEVSNII